MTRREALVALNMVPEVGAVRLHRLESAFGTLQEAMAAPVSALERVQGIGPAIARKVRGCTPESVARELGEAARLGAEVITIDDPGYPALLKAIPGAPSVLYVRGTLAPQDSQAIGVVGSRHATWYGLMNAEQFSAGLAQEKFTIVSGLARGIDTSAHKGALKAKGRTIAVMGSGFGCVYPEENLGLCRQISESGAVVSEFPCSMPPLKQNFPRRNRVISGLSLGVLVVEAARNSGALITADFALEQGREVFAIPGKVDSDTAFGPHALIKQGAVLVSSVEDIVQEFARQPTIRKERA